MIGLLSAKSSARSSFVSRALQTLAQARRQTEDGGVLRDNQNRSPSDNLPYIRWWSSVWRASWCQARSRQRREPKGLGFTAVCLPDIIIAGCSFRWMKLSSVSEA
jgi:hypothetical protein